MSARALRRVNVAAPTRLSRATVALAITTLVAALTVAAVAFAGPPSVNVDANTYAIPRPAASAASLQPAAVSDPNLVGNYGLEQALVTGAGDQHYPAVYGDLVVYEDGVAGGAANIKLYNRRTNAVTDVGTPSTYQWRPRIWGNRIVWMDYRNGNWDIYWYNIAKNLEYRLTTDTSNQMWPEINGDRIVWEDYRNGVSEVYMYDFAKATTTRITTDSHIQYTPRISGDRIVWADNRNGNFDIYWYDIAKKTEHRLSDDSRDEYEPDVWGTRAAWRIDDVTDILSAAGYFDANGKALVNVFGSGSISRPRIHGNTLTMEQAGTTPSIMAYRMTWTGLAFFTLDDSPSGGAFEPQMWGNNFTWFDLRSGNRDIYSLVVPTPTLSVSAPTAVNYGKTTTVTGQLVGWNGAKLANRDVIVEYQRLTNRYNYIWQALPAVKTNASGVYTAVIPAQPDKFWVQAYYNGDRDAFTQLSIARTVSPRVSLARPSGPTSISHTKTFSSSGLLKPQHLAGSKPVKIQCFRKENGRWRLKKTYTASVTNSGADSLYKATVKLPYTGAWRIRAYYPTSSTNAATYSTYRYITSK